MGKTIGQIDRVLQQINYKGKNGMEEDLWAKSDLKDTLRLNYCD